MVLAHHLIFTAYGFWLPNDPRGSWSALVRSWELYFFGGPATKVTTRRSIAAAPHDRALREAQKELLQYDPVHFNENQIQAVARGFARAIEESSYEVHACSILPEHAHIVVGRHHNLAERMIGHFKTRAVQQLTADGLHPFQDFPRDKVGRLPPPWTSRGWKVFLDTLDDIVRSVEYVECNPEKQGRPRQLGSFIRPFNPHDFI